MNKKKKEYYWTILDMLMQLQTKTYENVFIILVWINVPIQKHFHTFWFVQHFFFLFIFKSFLVVLKEKRIVKEKQKREFLQ